MATFEKDLHLPVTCVDATDQFLSKLKGVVDPERKRKIIGAEFIAVFDEFSHRLESEIGKKPTFLVQGTLYPDVIESCPPPGSGKSHSHTIKSHHNVGGLPKDMKLKLIEPLKWLFKDEASDFTISNLLSFLTCARGLTVGLFHAGSRNGQAAGCSGLFCESASISWTWTCCANHGRCLSGECPRDYSLGKNFTRNCESKPLILVFVI